jgi:ABC-type spermidine/putrescine transport system permease subunit II
MFFSTLVIKRPARVVAINSQILGLNNWVTVRHAMLPLNSVRFLAGILWNTLCQDNDNVYMSIFTKSLNVEIVSIVQTIEIKVWKVFNVFFNEISQET